MKKAILLITVLALLIPVCAFADNFLGLPLPQGEETLREEGRLEMTTALSHDQVVEFYRAALENAQDIKFRDWNVATYIEDDGKLKWHSITISKNETPTSVVIIKDNWTWIIGTLVLRYIAVFVVLLVLFVGMLVSGSIISKSVQKGAAKKAGAKA
ncbi:MAG: hypothetical protein ACOWYE_13925 [Desulfatiglandales bacterium]